MNRPVEYYLGLKYPVVVYEDPEGGYVAEVPDLPGCLTQGDSLEELFAMVEDAKRAWIEVALEMGKDVPEPKLEDEYSGKFLVRVPRGLHRRLAEVAAQEGTSLNQYVLYLLSSQVNVDAFSRHIENVSRSLDDVCAAISNIERSIHYALGPIPRRSSAYDLAPVVTIAGRQTRRAVAS